MNKLTADYESSFHIKETTGHKHVMVISHGNLLCLMYHQITSHTHKEVLSLTWKKTHCMLSPKENRSDKSGPESRLHLGKSVLMEWISIGI